MDRTVDSSEETRLLTGDPLWRFLTQSLGLPLPAIVGLAVTVGAIAIYGIGALVSYRVHAQANIIRVLDPDHLYYALVNTCIFAPSLWTLYLWQPFGVARAFDSLRRNEVILEANARSLQSFAERMRGAMGSPYVWIGAVTLSLAWLLIQTIIVWPAEMADRGKSFFWFYDKPYYFLVFVPFTLVHYYVATIIVSKAILTFAWFNLMFRRFEARVHPLHSDGVGGFGGLGSLAITYSLISVGIGAAATVLALVRLLFGTGVVYLDTLLFYAVYIVLTPAFLIMPLWSAHQAMVRARSRVLRRTSLDFDGTLERLCCEQAQARNSDNRWKTAFRLRARYRFIRETYPVWPLSLEAFRRFAVAAALPLATGVGSMLVDIIRK